MTATTLADFERMDAVMPSMRLVERHVIKHADPRYATIDAAAFAAKNLYNAATYEVRQIYLTQGIILSYGEIYERMKTHEAYRALPAKVAQWVLQGVAQNWQSFRAARDAWTEDPTRFLGRPLLPGYKDKQRGRHLLIYTIQAISVPALRQGLIVPSMLAITVKTILTSQQREHIQQVRIIPRTGFYVVEVVYMQETTRAAVNPGLHVGCDLGLNNLATLTSDKPGFVPRIVNGRPVKSINQYYNQERAKLQSGLKTHHQQKTSRRLERLTTTRTRRIDHYLHTASRRIIDLLVAEGIGTLVIGQNPLWKQHIHLGKRINQQFVSVPHARFIAMLTYKAELMGIHVNLTEESYTSKASFLDADPLPAYDPQCQTRPTFSGKRVARGLYRAADGRAINADVNGSYNIIRKVAPDAFKQGSRGCVVHPMRLAV